MALMKQSENKKAYDKLYRKEKLKRVEIHWLKEDFESKIQPAILKTGKPINTFIKEAVREKIEREGLYN